MASWAPSTRVNYEGYIKKWVVYCNQNGIPDPLQATYKQAMSFLSYLFYHENQKHGVIAVARSALSALLPIRDGETFGKHRNVSKLIKGIFKLRPTLPKYTVTYDPDIVLSYINNLPENSQLLLEMLTKKLCVLLCLLSGQRCQSIAALDLEMSHFSTEKVTFAFKKVLKTTKPGHHQKPLEFITFSTNKQLCVVNCLLEYRKRTDLVRENLEGTPSSLILSYAYPHKPVKSATIARYVKTFLGMAGIDITVFSAHSTRSASTSKGNNLGLSLEDIRKAGGWKGDSCFRRFYNLPIHKNFGDTLVQNFNTQA